MYWYIFNTPRGWAAVYGEKKIMVASILPSPFPLKGMFIPLIYKYLVLYTWALLGIVGFPSDETH